MEKEFDDIPKMPVGIINAIDSHNLLIFIGAGVSKLFGFPLWNEFANDLIDKCMSDGIITRSESNVIKNNYTSMPKVTLAYEKYKDKHGKDDALKLITEPLKENDKINKELVNEFANMLKNYYATILTTNADLSLDNSNAFKNSRIINSINEDKNIDFEHIDFIHLHGSIKEPKNMIFTSIQYGRAYRAGQPLGDNLQKLIKSKNVILFIGYSLSEFELLRYFLKDDKEDDKQKDKIINHYLLNGYLDCEKYKYEMDEIYYRTLGIKLIPFSLEKKGYYALVDVLKEWDNFVTTKTLAHLKIYDDIKQAVENPPSENSINFIRGQLKNE